MLPKPVNAFPADLAPRDQTQVRQLVAPPEKRVFQRRPQVVLIDGFSLVYRLFFAMQDTHLTSPDGQDIAMVHALNRALLNLLGQLPPYIIAVFDRGYSGREQIYPAYKAGRAEMPPALEAQLPLVYELLEAFSIQTLAFDGLEADDIIGTVAHKADLIRLNVQIVTGDRDLLQLINPRIHVRLRNPKETDWDMAFFAQKYDGLTPPQLIDLKALMGDASDNLPGVRGVGQVGAMQLIQRYGTLDTLYDNLGDLPKGLRQKLEAGREMAYLCRDMATIKRHLPVNFDPEASLAMRFQLGPVFNFYDRLGFGTGSKQAAQAVYEKQAHQRSVYLFPHDRPYAPPYEVVDTPQALEDLLWRLEHANFIVLDATTTHPDPYLGRLVGLTFTADGEYAYYIPLEHRSPFAKLPLFDEPETLADQLSVDLVIQSCADLLQDPALPKIAHEVGFLHVLLARYGVKVRGWVEDVAVADWALANHTSRELNLPAIAARRLQAILLEREAVVADAAFDYAPIPKAAQYSAANALIAHRLTILQQAEMLDFKRDSLRTSYQEVEVPLLPILAGMSMAGVGVDVAALEALEALIQERLRQAEQGVYDEAGQSFNLNSPQQLNEVLFERLRLPKVGLQKTKYGLSVGQDALEDLLQRAPHPILPALSRYRLYHRLYSQSVEPLRGLQNPRTGRLHTTFVQTASLTGRISTRQPNLQSFPLRYDEGLLLRQCMVASEGWLLVGADYAQIELRILAHLSADPALLDMFRTGEDVHRALASQLFGLPAEAISPDQRQIAKAIQFGLLYGMGAPRLARETGLTFQEARRFSERYFQIFQGVRDFFEAVRYQATHEGYVQTLKGRRRYFLELGNPHLSAPLRARLEREAVNTVVQGSAADCLKLALADLHQRLTQAKSAARPILQLHDEIIVEAPLAEVASVRASLQAAMEGALVLDVPLLVQVRQGPAWGDLV